MLFKTRGYIRGDFRNCSALILVGHDTIKIVANTTPGLPRPVICKLKFSDIAWLRVVSFSSNLPISMSVLAGHSATVEFGTKDYRRFGLDVDLYADAIINKIWQSGVPSDQPDQWYEASAELTLIQTILSPRWAWTLILAFVVLISLPWYSVGGRNGVIVAFIVQSTWIVVYFVFYQHLWYELILRRHSASGVHRRD